MASYARAPKTLNSDRVSVLAQAKPAIIAPTLTNGSYQDNQITSTIGFDLAAGALSEKLTATLKLNSSSQTKSCGNMQDRDDIKNDPTPKVRYIDDDSVIQKQNASNQMRQAAVLAAMASQQKVRLSATERLALTAKRPVTQPQPQRAPALVQVQQRLQTATQQPDQVKHRVDFSSPSIGAANKAALMPTLETLLAVQRQLQQHTKQRLNGTTQLTNSKQVNHDIHPEQSVGLFNSKAQQQHTHGKPLPPSPPRSPTLNSITRDNKTNISSVDTYDKDLPPLPPSISPSTSTDDSQLSSLESHQSSPATSLVSLPPPPPPISSYLQQYDEVNGYHRASSTSSPSTASTCEISASSKQYSMFNQQSGMIDKIYNQNQETENKIDLPLPFKNSIQSENNPTPVMSSQHINLNDIYNPMSSITQVSGSLPKDLVVNHMDRSTTVVNNALQTIPQRVQQNELNKVNQSGRSDLPHQTNNIDQLKRQPHQEQTDCEINSSESTSCSAATSTGAVSTSSLFLPPPPPPLSDTYELSGFDEPDSGSFRFPTPPPPEMLLKDDLYGDDEDDGIEKDANKINDQDIASERFFKQMSSISSLNNADFKLDGIQKVDDDEDFQCRIPSPPAQNSLPNSVLHPNMISKEQLERNQLQPFIEQKSTAIFDASSFSAPSMHMGLQPPPLFRQQSMQPLHQQPTHQRQQQVQQPQQQQQQQQQQQYRHPQQTSKQPQMHPQLTVYINNDGGGLLSTAPVNQLPHQLDANHQHSNHLHQLHHHHHHMMMTMTTSSSSPSSSSDGDGQSSNSSSSTSGIHSSIDSPSLSNSNDFNYSTKALMKIGVDKFGGLNLAAKHEVNRALSKVSTDTATSVQTTTKPRSALKKKKKTVSFSDKVELVACAEEQCEDHLPNPLLARVLAGKLQ